MLRTMLLILVVAVLAGCGFFSSAVPTETPVPPGQVRSILLVEPPERQRGEFSLEERILNTSTIVRATMTSFSSDVVAYGDGKYRAVLKFTLTVSEYLKGSGPTSVVAVAIDGQSYDTRAEAESAKARMLTARDAQWDNREAIFFLFHGATGLGSALDAQFQRADHFLLAIANRYFGDDRYSLHSRENKAWLPAATSGSSGSGARSVGKDQEYLLDVPSQEGARGVRASSTTSTIALNTLKTRIGELTTELNSGSSEAYKECVRAKYKFERREYYWQELDGTRSFVDRPTASELTSGLPASTVLYERPGEGWYPDQMGRTWYGGSNAALFSAVYSEPIPEDLNGDGVFTAAVDRIRYTVTLTTSRPLPAGEYEVVRKEVWGVYLPCNAFVSIDWTITVTAPTGTLHEAFFDPVAIGTTIGVDASNGVIDPDEFTVSSDDYEIESLVWRSNSVVMTLDDHVSLSGYSLDFIELDGSIDTTLDVADATVNQTSATWTWSVTSAPWEDGDQLMLRIRETNTGPTVAPTATPTPTPTPVPPTATPTPVPPNGHSNTGSSDSHADTRPE